MILLINDVTALLKFQKMKENFIFYLQKGEKCVKKKSLTSVEKRKQKINLH